MSKTGFLYVCAGKLQDDGTYKDGRYLGASATFNINPTVADAKDFGDNRVVETDTSVTGGSVTLEMNDVTSELNGYLLGHSVDEETGEVSYNQDDIAPFLGIGAIGTSRRNKVNKYIGKFYTKIQLKEPNDENQTKQENTNFTHQTLEGSVFVPEDGLWKQQCEFDTLKGAKDWLNEKVGITPVTGQETSNE